MGEGCGAVGHHSIRSRVELIVMRVEEDGLLPVIVALASMDELRDVQLRGVQLDKIHELIRLVLCVEAGKLCVHADVRPLVAQTTVKEADELLKVAMLLVLGDQLLQVVRVHNDVHAGNLRAAELLSLHASDVNLLPGLGVVGLACRLNCLGVFTELDMARGELRVVGDRLVEDLRGLVGALLVQAVADALNVGSVRAADELLHLPKALCLRIGVDELAIDDCVLGLDTGHE
mmetsp:Transcript_49881/g.106887  ORF Transcript_49881/g.106887 Transcript_49881/m.106887 type:complete len:232 (-) Transcript_49881:3532-4227(-)